METNREDFGIAIRSALLKKGTQQRFSLLVLVIFSVALLFLDKTTNKPISAFRSLVKDVIFKSSVITTYPSKSFTEFINFSKNHINLYKNNPKLTFFHNCRLHRNSIIIILAQNPSMDSKMIYDHLLTIHWI